MRRAGGRNGTELYLGEKESGQVIVAFLNSREQEEGRKGRKLFPPFSFFRKILRNNL